MEDFKFDFYFVRTMTIDNALLNTEISKLPTHLREETPPIVKEYRLSCQHSA